MAIEENGAELSCDQLPTVLGRETPFVQLFQNLIGNSIKYRGENAPRIRVSAAWANDCWRLGISDNGIGIAPEYSESVFGVFKRLHGKNIPGTGIGLAICKRVVERLGGRIWVESQATEGSTFYFTIPVTGNGNSEQKT